MPSDSDPIVIDHVIIPNEYRGVPTFALRSGGRRPLLMNRLGGRGERSEEELVRMLGNYATKGYVYNPNGLTYGDMNALLNETGNWFDDWDGYFALYMWDETGNGSVGNATPSMELIFKHDDDEGLYEEVIMDIRDLPQGRMAGFGKSEYRPASRRVLERAGVQMASESMTKESTYRMPTQKEIGKSMNKATVKAMFTTRLLLDKKIIIPVLVTVGLMLPNPAEFLVDKLGLTGYRLVVLAIAGYAAVQIGKKIAEFQTGWKMGFIEGFELSTMKVGTF